MFIIYMTPVAPVEQGPVSLPVAPVASTPVASNTLANIIIVQYNVFGRRFQFVLNNYRNVVRLDELGT